VPGRPRSVPDRSEGRAAQWIVHRGTPDRGGCTRVRAPMDSKASQSLGPGPITLVLVEVQTSIEATRKAKRESER